MEREELAGLMGPEHSGFLGLFRFSFLEHLFPPRVKLSRIHHSVQGSGFWVLGFVGLGCEDCKPAGIGSTLER